MRITVVIGAYAVRCPLSRFHGDCRRSNSPIASRSRVETADRAACHGLRDARSRSISRTRRIRSIVAGELGRGLRPMALSSAASLRRSSALSASSASSARRIRVMRARSAAFCSTSVRGAWTSEADSASFCLFAGTLAPLSARSPIYGPPAANSSATSIVERMPIGTR
jgi:hypothetical protein